MTATASGFDEARLTPRYWATFSLIVAQLVCEIFDFFVVSFLVSAIAPKWGLTYGQSTVIFFAAGLGTMVGAVAFGWLSDRFGRKVAIVGGGILYSLSAGAIALIPEGAWVAFALLRFLVGVGYGGAGSSQFALIAEYTPTRLRTLMTSSLGVPAALGVVMASTVVAVLYPLFGWRGIAAIGAAPIVLAVAIAFVAPESARWKAARSSPGAAKAPRPSPLDVWRDQRRFWLIVLIQIGMGAALTGVLLWGPTIAGQVLKLPVQKAAGAFVWITVCGLVGRIAFVFLSMKLGRVKCGILMGYGGAVFIALAAVFHSAVLGAIPAFLLFLAIGELFFDGGFSNINPYAPELYPVRVAAQAAGVASASGGIGKILGPVALGLIAGAGELVSPHATEHAVVPGFLFLAGCCLMAGLAYSFLGVETHGKTLRLE